MADPSPALRSIRNHCIAGLVGTAFLVLGIGGWAATAQLAGAVIGPGTVVVDGHVKMIQHREGGIVGEILVRNGSRVFAGDVLVRLDDTITRANLAIIATQMDQLTARRLRLIAERDGAAGMTVPPTPSQGDLAEVLAAEQALFTAIRQTLHGQQAQLRQRIEQVGQEREGLKVRLRAKEEEISWIGRELEAVRALNEQQLVQFPRLAELERRRAQLDGERGQLLAEIARAATRISETELQILQLEQDRRTEVVSELRDVDNRLAELAEQRVAAEDALRRSDILAPQDGIVHELAVHTINGVIAPGETVLQIVPVHETLVVEARIEPDDIDQVHAGQSAALRFSAFNQNTTPELSGNVETVAAELSTHPQTGASWYTVRIRVSPEELERLGSLSLVPGMPVEAFIRTGERTALSFLLKPLRDQLERALREE